jgi:hypothetical protein
MDLLERSAVKVIGSPIENRRELQQLSGYMCGGIGASLRTLTAISR